MKASRQFHYSVTAITVIGVLGCLLGGCNARVDGCLDPEAANFDVTVDRDDRSLCVYPNMLLSLTYTYGDTSFARNRLYENNDGQMFSISALYVLFSQFQLNGDEYGRRMVIDETQWLVEPDNVTSVANDFTFVDNLKFIYRLGMWDVTDHVNQMRFTVGVPDTLTPTKADSLSADNKLDDPRAYYNEAQQQFATARFIYVLDSLAAEPDTVVVSSGPIGFEYTLDKQLTIGEDDTLRLKIDFETLFGGADFKADSSSLASFLAERLEGAISNNN